MNRRRVGEDRGSKEMDGCPLTTISKCQQFIYSVLLTARDNINDIIHPYPIDPDNDSIPELVLLSDDLSSASSLLSLSLSLSSLLELASVQANDTDKEDTVAMAGMADLLQVIIDTCS
jgi:hypothetical protein